MTTDVKKLEAMQKQAYFESKLQMVPASIKEVYSAISGEDILIARELVVDDHVLIGIEYTPEGEAAAAYTTDKTGKRITLDRPQRSQSNTAHAPKDLISERLDEVAKNISRQPMVLAYLTPGKGAVTFKGGIRLKKRCAPPPPRTFRP